MMIGQTHDSYRDLKALKPNSLEEIEGNLRKGYLNRLGIRVKKLRKLIVERDWEKLREECSALSVSGDSFGFSEVATLAAQVQMSIPDGKVSRAATPSRGKAFAELLVNTIDSILIDSRTLRN